jgi:hypothetical protein
MPFIDSGLHLNEAQTDFAIGFRQEEEGYLWSKLLPPKTVKKRSDYIRQIDKGQLLRKYDLRVGKGGRVAEVQFKIGANLSFNAIDYAVEAVMRATESSNADSVLQYEQELTYHACIAMHTNLEVITVKETLRDPTQMTNNVDLSVNASDQWDQYNSVSSDPVEDIKRRVLRIKTRTGRAPNLCVMHDYVWDVVQRHPSVLARGPVNPTGMAIVTKEMFEKMCDLPPGSLITTSMTYNLAAEDQTADFRSFIGPDVILAYTEAGGLRNYGLGQSFLWPGDVSTNVDTVNAAGMGGVPFVVLQFPDNNRDPRGANVLRIVGGLDQKILVPDAGELLINVVDKTNTVAYGNFLNN